MVTVVFADLAGFTSMAEGRDPEQVKELLDRCFGVMVPVIEAFGGHVDKLIGDELMALFGAPTAHEDDPERAVRAGLGLAPALTPLAPDLVLRVGVNTGEVLAGPVGPGGAYTVTGDTVNTAHRLVSVARPGEVLVAEKTWAATGSAVEYEERGTFELRGKQQPVRAWAALRPAPAGDRRAARPNSPLVGREADLAELTTLVDRALTRRRPLVVTVTGEAGVGKTRLAQELVRHLAGEGTPALWATCPAYGAANGLAPVADLVRGAIGVDTAEPAAEQVRRIAAAASRIEPRRGEAELLVSRLGRLLGVDEGPSRFPDPGSVRGRVVDQLLWGAHQLLLGLGSDGPRVLVLDDVQWADDAVLRFLAQLPGALDGTPVVAVALAREDLLERRPSLVTAGPGTASLALAPLDADQSRRLIGQLLVSVSAQTPGPGTTGGPVEAPSPEGSAGHEALDDLPRLGVDVEPRILGAAGGNPFLVEQLVGYLIDTGTLVEVDGRWQVDAGPDELGVPDGVRSLLGARLDALPSDERELLLDAAVVGRSFSLEVVDQLRTADDSAELVDRLVAKGLLTRQPDRGGLEDVAFAHALTRDVAYAAVPLGQRAHKHAQVAAWLQGRLDGDDGGAVVGSLAHHYERAVMLGRSLEHTDPGLAEAAFDALVRAAQRAESYGALREAEEWYRRAHQLGSHDTAAATRAVLGLGRVLTELRQLEAAAGAFEEAEAMADGRQEGDSHPELAAEAVAHLGAVARLEGDGDRARDLFERALEDWRRMGDLSGEADTVRLQGWSDMTVGRVRAALPRLLRAADLERAAGVGPRGTTLQSLGWCEFQVGAVAEAQEHLWLAMESLGQEGSPIEAAWCMGILGFSFLVIGQLAQARSVAENLLELARIQSDPWTVGRCRLLLAACLVAQAEVGEAERLISKAERPLSDREMLWEQSMLHLIDGRIARTKGDVERARRALQRGLETSRGTSYVGAEARLLIELAGLELECGNLDEAEDRARATLAVVRAGLGDDDSQLRARVVLARVAHQRGDTDQAELQLQDVVATGAGRGPITDTWRVANAELAQVLVETGQLDRARQAVERAADGGVETVRVALQVAVAHAGLLAAEGRVDEALAELDRVLERHPLGPVFQRRMADDLHHRLAA